MGNPGLYVSDLIRSRSTRNGECDGIQKQDLQHWAGGSGSFSTSSPGGGGLARIGLGAGLSHIYHLGDRGTNFTENVMNDGDSDKCGFWVAEC